jgi:4'-phosphopantetheinyl transferase
LKPAGWDCLSPSQPLLLPAAEVHVWRATVNLNTAELGALQKVLSPDEQARVERFYFEKDRRRFIACRGTLREILARYLKCEAARLEFSCSRFGKPSLAPTVSGDNIHFNLSHSNDLALYAVSRFPEIGVDLEWVRKDFPCDQIAQHYFTPREIKTLRSLPDEMKYEAFFNGWTRKEAFVKARGKGLSLPLDRFTVSLAPGEPAALLRTEDNSEEASRWVLMGIIPADGYLAAIAAKGRQWQLKCWQWPKEERSLVSPLLTDVPSRF